MSDPESEGGHDEEAPAWNNLWGKKEPYVDPLMTAFHDIPDELNSLNQHFGWTRTANNANINAGAAEDAAGRAAQAEQLAKNAEAMGNDDFAAKFAARSKSLEGTAQNFESLSEQRGTINAIFENPAMKIGGNVAGAALGGLNIYNGIQEWDKGKKTQGAADIGAGGLGVVAGLAGAGEGIAGMAGATGLAAGLGTVGAVAAPAAIVAGLAALGNGESQKLGVWDFMGKNKDGSSMDSIQMVGHATSSAYHGVDNAVEGALGNHWYSSALGKGLGGLAGAGTAIGTGAMGLVTDVGLGAYDVGKGVVNAGKAIGSGIGNVASKVGSGIGSAAKSVGHFVSHLW